MSEQENNTQPVENKDGGKFGIPTYGWLIIYAVAVVTFTYFFDSFVTEWKMSSGRLK